MSVLPAVALVVGLAITPMVVAPAAHATEQTFLNSLAGDGIIITDAAAAVQTGYLACSAMDQGYTPVQVAMAVKDGIPSLSYHQAGWVVGAAIANLCP